MSEEVYDQVQRLIDPSRILVSLGGDHTLSAPLIKAHSEKFHNLSVLQLDAHVDLRDEYDGTKYCHTTVMRRVAGDLKIPIVQCGIRNLSYSEALAVQTLPVKVFFARDIVGRTDWWEKAVEALTENVYVTIDIDVFDPSLIPETGTPEPGGLDWYEVTGLIRSLARRKRIIGMDLVEYAPSSPEAGPGAFIAAKLIYRALGYIYRGKLEPIVTGL